MLSTTRESSFLLKYFITDNYIAVPITSLQTVCIYMNINNEVYIGLPINNKERESKKIPILISF